MTKIHAPSLDRQPTVKTQVDFDDFETDAIKEIKKNKIHQLQSQDLKTRITGALMRFAGKFMTQKSYQRGLFIYLVVVLPTGTYYVIKNIILGVISIF